MAKKGFEGTLEKQLKIYSATAAGVLALVPSADAAIHYSGLQNLLVDSSNTPRNIDLNGDASIDFKFSYIAHLPNFRSISVAGQNGAELIRHDYVIRLASNYQIKGTLPNVNYIWANVVHMLNATNSGTTSSGYFNNTIGYIGVRFHTTACQGSDWNYGWIQYQGTTVLNSLVSGTIIDWAYEDSCNTVIAAGAEQTKTTKSVPTLDHWGMIVFMLLLGGLAARKLRKQEKEDS
jgi:hypothetical protein